MNPRALLLAAMAAGFLVMPGAMAAHGGGVATVIIPTDHIDPGQPFPVIASDFGSDADVTFELVQLERTVGLGTITAGPDGHFDATLELPADFALGYAELVGTDDAGAQTSTWVLVGTRTASTPAPPSQPALWQDPAVLLMIGLLLGGGLIVGAIIVRNVRRAPAAVARRPRRRKAQNLRNRVRS